MKRNMFVLAVSLLMVAFMLTRSDVLRVYADCGETGVGVGGADCGIEGGTPGTPSDSGTDTDNGQPGNSGNNNNNNNGNGGVVCTPGTFVDWDFAMPVGSSGIVVPGAGTIPLSSDATYSLPDGSVVSANGIPGNMCMMATTQIDSCTGEIVGDSFDLGGFGSYSVSECPSSYEIPENPCDEFTVSGGGVTCTSDLVEEGLGGSNWEIRAHAGWPGIEIHARPFPITLVDWDTLMRVAGLGASSGSGRLAYAPWGGGSGNSPDAGDWRDVILRLEIKPITNWADVYIENIGLIRMPIGRLHTFQWNLPSHPAAGGGPLAGEVGQLEELEADTPLYSNWTRAPYMVYCTLEYYEWESSCVSGPDENGGTNCRHDSNGFFTGHREWGWKHHSQTIP
ncbi:MAG TPA: hypothetical protein VLA72_17170, partial [Anaerolineales bacterium]|nr:hypothetical protein [Anaerolineales bacterium]